MIERKIWMTGWCDEKGENSEIYFHVLDRDKNGNLIKYKFKGEII